MDEAVRRLSPDPSVATASLTIPRPQSETELREAVDQYLGVRIPDVRVCAGHHSPWEAFCDAYFARSPWSLWVAARALGGKTMLLATLAWMEALTLKTGVTVLGGSFDQSRRVHEYMRQFWNLPTAPREVLASDTSRRSTTLIWNNTVEAQAASMTAARGAHAPRLRCDEVDEMDWAIIEAARGQPLSKPDVPSHVVFSSTHQYADGPVSRLVREAGAVGAPIFRWCHKETAEPHGWLSRVAAERYRATVSAELWRVEVELGEPSPEGRAIDSDAVERMCHGPEIPDPAWQVMVAEPPVPGASYASGCDWAKERDETAIVTLRDDGWPIRVVAYEHGNRLPWPVMNARFMTRLRTYRGAAAHDAGGVGSSEADRFTEDVEKFLMVGARRTALFMDLTAAIERDEIRAPRWRSLYQALKFVRHADLYGAGHPPDALVALALAYQASGRARTPFGLAGQDVGRRAVPREPVPTDGLGTVTALLGRRE